MALRIMRLDKREETRASEIVKKMIESIDLLTGLIAQLPAQEFASRRLGKLLQDLNMPGIFIICHALLTKVDQLLGCDLPLKPAFRGENHCASVGKVDHQAHCAPGKVLVIILPCHAQQDCAGCQVDRCESGPGHLAAR